MTIAFNPNRSFTLGVELELQLVDAESLALANEASAILARVPAKWAEKIKPEFMQCYCEINTDVCQTVGEVERDLTDKLLWAQGVAGELGLRFVWAGAHPFSRWDDQKVSHGDRYAWLLDAMQDIARRMLVFGLHVHVGVDSGDKVIQMCDRLLRHLPIMLAMSANSPMWCGRVTGMRSYRSKIIEALPNAGLPVTMRNWSEYVWIVNHLISTKFISSQREIWWDVRPHAGFGTIEVRVFDMPMNLKHTLGFVALTQSLIAALSDQIDRGAYLYDCHPMIAQQNKWRAARYGMEATFVDPDTMKAVAAMDAAQRLIDFCMPYADRLGCAADLAHLYDIVEHGTGARRQLEIHRHTADTREVVKYLIRQAELRTIEEAGAVAPIDRQAVQARGS